MSNKTTRIIVRRSLDKLNGVEQTPVGIVRKTISPYLNKGYRHSPYLSTLRHIRANTRNATRVKVARAFEKDKLSKPATFIIEQFESYLLRKKHANQEALKIGGYLRKYNKDMPMVKNEVMLWYIEHGKERIKRMRKQHAVVGSQDRPILRTE